MGIGLNVRFVGLKSMQRHVAKAGAKFPSELKKRLVEASANIEGQAKLNMRGNRTRAIREGRKITSPPNVLGIDTSHLRQSITSDVSVSGKKYRAEIGPQRVVYARIHELGGIAGRARIPKRPYLGPAVKKHEKRTIELLGRSFKVV